MRRYLLLLFVSVCVLAGCGGGGPSVAVFTYQTQWNSPNGGIDGQSQSIQLFDQNNILKFTATLDKPTTIHRIFGVPTGIYHIHVDLFSGTGEQGTLNGSLDDLITINNSTTYTTSVGPAVTHVRLAPASATIKVQHTQQFFAVSEVGTNLPTFTAEGGFNWQTLGGVATVDQNGLVTGSSAGPGSVTATNQAASVTGAATLTIEASSSTHSKWTVIVFMNAANNLFADSILNMNQMAKVSGIPANVRFVVEWKQSTNVEPGSTFNSTRRYVVNATGNQLIQDLGPGYDMGSAANMLDFITWTKANYPADRYCLVVWDHGNGWKRSLGRGRGVSYDDESGNHIDTWQFTQALGNTNEDILAWDSSLMQQLEVAEEIHDKATYIVGSEESPPEQGYPYDKIFAHFRDTPDATTLTLAKTFVDETLAFYDASFDITQSVIDTSQLSGLVNATSSLGDALIANVGSLGTIVPLVRQQAETFSDNPINGHYRDLYDVCLKLENNGAPAAVVTAEQAVRTAVPLAVVYEGHHANVPGAHGISIDFSSMAQFTTGSPSLAQDYQNLRFGQETHWGQWLSIAP